LNTTIILIRHGETDWNVSGRWQGQKNLPLNDRGFAQARRLAERLRSWPIAAIYSSDLKRALQTAAVLGEALGIKPNIDAAWRERHGGAYEGRASKELRGSDARHLANFRESDWAPPGGESNIEVANRVSAAFDEIVNLHSGKMVAVVSHGGAMHTLLSGILGLQPGERARLSVSLNTGFSIVEIGDRGPYLTRLNDCHHLGPDNSEQVMGIG
jgi:broad specificity phosphatase PhoE